MKRRWIVVMLGLRGLATGHRSELSRHRSQESARIAALESLARLREGHAPFGPDYTVVVEHGEQQFLVDDEDGAPVTDPWSERGRAVNLGGPGPIEELLEVAPTDEPSDEELTPEPVPVTGESTEAEVAAEPEPATPTTYAATDPSDPEETTVRRRRPREVDTPEGPVPDGLLSQWEQKVAAYDEWEARQSDRDSAERD